MKRLITDPIIYCTSIKNKFITFDGVSELN